VKAAAGIFWRDPPEIPTIGTVRRDAREVAVASDEFA